MTRILSNESFLLLIVLLVGVLLVPSIVAAESTFGATVFTKKIISSRDNTLYESAAGNLSNGKGGFFFVGRTNQTEGAIRRALLFFDIESALPADAMVETANLRLRCTKVSSGDTTTLELHRATSAWGEGASEAPGMEGQGGDAEPGDATWINTFFDTEDWAVAGGDFDPALTAATLVGDVGIYSWGPTPQMIGEVQGWIDNPGNNFGWLVFGDENAGAPAKRFNTHEHLATSNAHPSLFVSYLSKSTIFFDDFESGDTDLWTTTVGIP